MSYNVVPPEVVSTDRIVTIGLAGAYFAAIQLVFWLSSFTTTTPVTVFLLPWRGGVTVVTVVAAVVLFAGFATLAVVFAVAVVSGPRVASVVPLVYLAAMTATEVFGLSLGPRAIAPRVEATMWLYLAALPFVAVLAALVAWFG